eukprot:Pgem_evm2s7580
MTIKTTRQRCHSDLTTKSALRQRAGNTLYNVNINKQTQRRSSQNNTKAHDIINIDISLKEIGTDLNTLMQHTFDNLTESSSSEEENINLNNDHDNNNDNDEDELVLESNDNNDINSSDEDEFVLEANNNKNDNCNDNNTNNNNIDEAEKRMKSRKNIIRELVTSESTYTNDVQRLIDYKDCFIKNNILKPYEIDALFENIEALFQFVTSFNEQLQQVMKDETTMTIGSVFKKYIKEFDDTYNLFCLIDRKTVFQNLVTKSKQFKKLQEKIGHKDEKTGHDITLKSLISQPMQRMCKYPLLLQRLLKYTDDVEEQKRLKLAFENTSVIISNINRILSEKCKHETQIESKRKSLIACKLKRVDSFQNVSYGNGKNSLSRSFSGRREKLHKKNSSSSNVSTKSGSCTDVDDYKYKTVGGTRMKLTKTQSMMENHTEIQKEQKRKSLSLRFTYMKTKSISMMELTQNMQDHQQKHLGTE